MMSRYLEIAKEILEKRYVVGVRSLCDDEQYEVGDDCRESYEWDFENDCSTYHTTGETAGGTCATAIDTQGFLTDDWAQELAERIKQAINANEQYFGDRQAIIAGYRVNNDRCLDPGEIRIREAFVLALV